MGLTRDYQSSILPTDSAEDPFFAYWTPFIVGARTEVVVALDWTSFAADGQDTIVLSMVTGHGRATPLLWKTVASSTLKGNQRRYEYEVLCRLREVASAKAASAAAHRVWSGEAALWAMARIAQHSGNRCFTRPENLVVTTAIAEASPFPWNRTKTPRECPGCAGGADRSAQAL